MVPISRVWSMEQRGDPFDRAIEGLLIGVLAFMPLAFGAVEAWSEEVVLVLTAVMSVCFLLKLIVRKQVPITWTWAYVPIVVFLLVVVVHLIPLPSGWVRLLSPNTAALKTELLGGLPDARGELSHMTLTFYPYATRHDLRLVLATVVVFVVVFNVYRRSEQIVRLLGAITIIGAAVALLCLLQNVAGNDKIYWFVSSPHGTAHSGPFVNHSHYAQFMNLSIGAALGLIFVKVHQRFLGRRVTPVVVAEYLSSPSTRVVWAVVAMVVVGLASVFVSLSRGGMIGTMFAGAFMTLVLTWKKSLRGPAWIMAFLALGAFICVLYVGFDAVYDRLGTLRELQRAEGGRWQVGKDVAVAWTRFPLMGTGLGSHEVVYPMFDRSRSPALSSHAENEYAQAAEETGAVGLVALVAFGVVVWSGYARALRASGVPIRSAAFGLGFGLTAILVHSLSDFGQHMPANALLSATFCGLMLRLPHMGRQEGTARGETVLAGKQAARWGIVGLIVATLFWGWALHSTDAARRGEAYWAKALSVEDDLMERNWQAGDDEYTALLSDAAKARDCQPSNIKYRHWLSVYRWNAISRATDPNTGDVVLSPPALRFVERIADELKQSLRLCPTFGPSWCVLGQLEKFVLERDEEGARHIRRGRKLAPCDPTTCLVAGLLHAEERNPVAAFDDWRRAVELDERLFDEVSSSLVGLLGRSDLAYELAADNAKRLIRLENILHHSQENPDLLETIRAHILRLLEQETRDSGAPAWQFVWLAQQYRKDGNAEKAIEMYRQALALEYSQVVWRFWLAELLAEHGLAAEATRELKICLRLHPRYRAAQRLFATLTAQLSAGGSPY